MTAELHRGSTDLLSPRPVQVHPLCRLDPFGRNKLGSNLYRIVFAPSRFYLVGKTWDDGKTEYRFMPLYKAKGWVLERWLSPQEYCGMGPERWEIENKDWQTGLFITGPYPHQGEYEMCWDFEANEPTSGYASRVIGMIEAGRLKSYNEHLVANREHTAKENKAREEQQFAEIQNEMPTFRGQVLSGPGGKIRQFKTRKEAKSANELGLPTSNRKFVIA